MTTGGTSQTTGGVAVVTTGNPSILNPISLNASRDRINELFKDFKRLNVTDSLLSGDAENGKAQHLHPPQGSEQLTFRHVSCGILEADITHSSTSIDIGNTKSVKEQEEKITALYVGDLDIQANEEALYNHFKNFRSLSSVKICYSPGSKSSLGYGYINFTSKEEAHKAIEELNYTPILGKEIRIMPSLKGRDKLNSLGTNVFISNLNVSEITSLRAFFEKFRTYGKILSCKLDPRKRQGFISFEDKAVAERFVVNLNETIIDGLKIYCSIHIPKYLRNGSTFNLSVYPTNNFFNKESSNGHDQITATSPTQPPDFKKNASDSTLESVIYTKHAEVLEVSPSHSALMYNTISRLIKSPIDSPVSPSLSSAYTFSSHSPNDQSGFKQVYVKGLPVNITEDQLKSIFTDFGEITEVYKENVPKFKSSWGLVTFDSDAAAFKAINTLHKSTYEGKKITCVKALKKTDRQVQLEMKEKPSFAQLQRVPSLTSSIRGPNPIKDTTFKLYMYNLPKGINENFFKLFLRSYTLQGEIKKYSINYPNSKENYIEFEKEADVRDVLVKLNGVQISGNVLQASLYRLSVPHSDQSGAFATPSSIRRVSFQEVEKPDKSRKKVYNYSNEKKLFNRSNSAIFQPSQGLKVGPYVSPGQIIPSTVAKSAPLFQTINGTRYKLVPISRNATFSEEAGFFSQYSQPMLGSNQTHQQHQPQSELSRSPSVHRQDRKEKNSGASVVLRLEQLANDNINFLQFPSATRPRNLKRIIQYMIDTIWLNNYNLIRQTLEQVESDPKALDEFKNKLNESLIFFGFER